MMRPAPAARALIAAASLLAWAFLACAHAEAEPATPEKLLKTLQTYVDKKLCGVKDGKRPGPQVGTPMTVTADKLGKLAVDGERASAEAHATVKEGDYEAKATWQVAFALKKGASDEGTWQVARIAAEPLYLRALLKRHVDDKIYGDLVDKDLDPERETPMKVLLTKLDELKVAGDKATATAHVLMKKGDEDVEGTWAVEFKLDEGGGGWQVGTIKPPTPEFGTVNYTVLILYLIAMLAIGWWTSRFIKGTRGFFIAEGRLNHIIVGISILTAYLSALTMMAIPGVAFKKLDWLFAFQLPFLIFTAFVITQFVLKRYRESGVISVYAYLERRIHVSSRLLASFSFILFSIGRMGIVLYLPALAFSMVTGAPLLWTIVLMGAVVTVYTVMGGIEAVIWTDFVQAIIMVAGAVVSVAFILAKAGGAQFMQIAAEHHKFRMIHTQGDLTSLITLFLVLETIFQTIRIYGTQQDITQRYMTTRSTQKANASVWIAILGFIPFCLLFFFIGTALFVYYKVSPDVAVPAMLANGKAAAIYPYFVANELPPVIAGLVIAAIFAAAMSSIDACMNASSTVCVQDFYRRFRRQDIPDKHFLNVARWLTVIWGALATAMAILMMDIRTVQIVWGKIMAISTNGVLGLMALAFLKKPVRAWAAVVGFISSYVCLFVMMWFLQVKPTVIFTFPVAGGSTICYLLWPVFGNLTCFVVALVLDRIVERGNAAPAETEAV